MVLQNSSAENCPWLQRFRGAGTAPCWEGERDLSSKNTPSCSRLLSLSPQDLWSPLSPLGLGAEPGRACVDRQTHCPASGRQQSPRREGWGISKTQKGCGCTSWVKVLVAFWDSDLQDPPWHPLVPAARAGSHPAAATKGASPHFCF